MHFINFYVSHRIAMRFLKGGEKYFIYFVDNLLQFPALKEFSKSVNV